MSIICTIYIQKLKDKYVATDIASGFMAYGQTMNESIKKLKRVLEVCIKDEPLLQNPPPVFITTLEIT